MVQILHISDTHLGKRQYSLVEREKDIYDIFSQLVDIAIKEHVDVIIHSGDLFDVSSPTTNALVMAIKILKRLKDVNIPFLSIPGDHDTPKRKGYLIPHNILSELDLIKILNYEKPYIIKGIEVYGIPHIPTVSKSILVSALSALRPKSSRSILLLHQGVKQILPYDGSWQMELGSLPKGFGYYALGHIHTRWRLTQDDGSVIAIAGSPDIMREEEIEGYEKFGKGAYLIDFSKDLPILSTINITVRPQKVVTINTKNIKKDILTIRDDLIEHNKSENNKPILHIIVEGERMRKDLLYKELLPLNDVALYYRIYKDETTQTVDNLSYTLPRDKGLDKIIIEYLTKYEKFSEDEANLILQMIKNVESDEIVNEILKKLTGVNL
ncbi:exonuclease SbcCD subunit D [Saccharolobus solfataricus]|uniref:DNA double-strand break repair protein Mre11 n=3 Tax=Saccharolobus solfataricus TaxID=2287 RepID=MRE11_SACS2|nr:DNA double-strand break repair protein Mre11 [Saccharolobus solfataricus]Q97WG9.1 RecName: Full=DNA double-strand break repair protein Mre11 [Saccharolobus solfataricus P2]AAK42418.1 DNA repair protein (rad32/mre11) [Saccharolobus solfataricus P2]AKA72519.1 exonuclease SbcCD subunit D [Saccharolobus solfataricus]AKA75218.1 exonuclease SbcCD subunit D [Saccharolobus solfataricus]AKA77911.1 exonuclease SbcCD subunit D [Saccharolobus solfataricus]AZF67029.1 exonuclease SbcCD subunit D [Saccha